MSGHAAFRRQPVPGEMALRHSTVTLPAPIRGIVENENWAYVKPGCANIIDNWFPTQKGLRLRGGTERWATLPAPVEIVRSGFNYISGANHRMFAATSSRLFDVTFADTPVLQTGVGTITNGNFSTAQLATEGGDWLLAVNDPGDYIRRFNGTAWEFLNTAFAGTPSRITAPVTAPAMVQDGKGLTYIWKYRERLFFIQGGTFNAWCLPVHAIGGELIHIPLSGAAKRGGSLLFGASWSTGDTGDGGDDKCCFFTDQGEVLVFSGTDPTSITNWKQDGRYDISKPLGKNGHQQLGADVLIITIDGIVPLSAAIQKDVSALSLAAITYNIEPTWMREFRTKDAHPWTIAKWDEGDAMFITFPGGISHKTKTVGVSNLHTGAWARYVGWDAMCFMQLRGSLFFGTQTGTILQVDSTGLDDAQWDAGTGKNIGNSYVCTMVGGWEMFQAPPNQVTWLQARAAFFSSAREPFEPQLGATTDYEFRIPPPPNPGPDFGLFDVWDQGLWGIGGGHFPTPWKNLTVYTAGTNVYDTADGSIWTAQSDHITGAPPITFAETRVAIPALWVSIPPTWKNLTAYAIGDILRDDADSSTWKAQNDHITGEAPITFAETRAAIPTLWVASPPPPFPPAPPPTPAERDAYAQWDQESAPPAPVKNTMWVSIGETGFSHAPICQVSVAQQVKPEVELIAISATFVRMAANV